MLARRTWPQRPKFVQGSLEPVENLAPLPSPFLSGVFLNVILRISPFFLWCVPERLFVAGNTFLSLLSLSLPLPFFPSRFPLFTLFLGRPWMLSSWLGAFLFGVSLDACAVAGNTFASFSPSFSFPPPLPPLSSRVAYLQAN